MTIEWQATGPTASQRLTSDQFVCTLFDVDGNQILEPTACMLCTIYISVMQPLLRHICYTGCYTGCYATEMYFTTADFKNIAVVRILQ